MNLLRALGAVIVGLELFVLAAIRFRADLDYPVSRIVTVALCLVLASLVVLLIRSTPLWLVCVALFISGLPIMLGWFLLSILAGFAGK